MFNAIDGELERTFLMNFRLNTCDCRKRSLTASSKPIPPDPSGACCVQQDPIERERRRENENTNFGGRHPDQLTELIFLDATPELSLADVGKWPTRVFGKPALACCSSTHPIHRHSEPSRNNSRGVLDQVSLVIGSIGSSSSRARSGVSLSSPFKRSSFVSMFTAPSTKPTPLPS